MENVAHAGMVGPWQIILILVFFGLLALWIKTIVEISISKYADNNKTTWLLVVILLGLLGMIIYYAAGRSQRINENSNRDDVIDGLS